MTIKRINPISCAKIMGLLYAVIGFLIGALAALVSLAGGLVAAGVSRATGPLAIFGVGAIVLFPIIYGLVGFIMTWIAAAIYNVLAGVVGGIQIDVVSAPNPNWNAIEGTRAPSV